MMDTSNSPVLDSISTTICKSNYFNLYIIKVKEVIIMSIPVFMISKGREQDRRWKEECPYCDYSCPDGYGTCENCGQWTTGWWEPVEKGKFFKGDTEDVSPCDGIATVAIEGQKVAVRYIEEHSCVSHTEDKKVDETYYLRIPVTEGDSKEEIESRAMEKFFRNLC